MKNEKYQIEYGLKNTFAFLSSWVMALGTDGIYETINNIEYWTGVKVPLMGIPRDVCNGIYGGSLIRVNVTFLHKTSQ